MTSEYRVVLPIIMKCLTWTTIILASLAEGRTSHRLHISGLQAVNLWRIDAHARARQQDLSLVSHDSSQATFDFNSKTDEKKPYHFYDQWFEQPLDHFDKQSKHTFRQRYWVNQRHYKPRRGAPVIVLDGGETSGEDRLPFLDTGIVEILTRATGGIGVVLEHRYYGESIPVTNFSTDALRFLNNAQSAADSANFMRNVKFDGIAEDLTAPNTPWIYYGGSYAGARAAHMKILYPDIVWGAIASSAVTHATLENWQYMDVIRTAADPKCSARLVDFVSTIDSVIANVPEIFKKGFKSLFGLQDLEHDDDFVSVLMIPLEWWQNKCWDPEFGSTMFDEFCESLDKPLGRSMSAESSKLVNKLGIDVAIINYGLYIKKNIVSRCPQGLTVEDCFGTYDDSKYQDTRLDQDWRLWTFQVCTEWGYFTTSPPDQNRPRIISRLLTLEYQSKICRQAFPPGKHFSVPSLPNITVVNALGDFDIAADRLAFIDGEVDPWRPNTPHSEDASDREDTTLRPFKLIPNAVHHYDEWGWKDLHDEPPEIRKVHAEMIDFVTVWLQDWNVKHGIHP